MTRRPKPTIALAATLHDPTGALLRDVRRGLPLLAERYAAVAIATSPPTAARVVAALRDAGVHAGSPATNARGPLYRLSIRAALAGGAPRVHYLDFDRALHWLWRERREYDAVLRRARREPLLVIGRTRKAHATHQRPLLATEAIANRLFAERLGLRGRVDFLAPSFVLDAGAARTLVARSRTRDEALYGEWPALLAGLGLPFRYVEGRGLDWETPDRDRAWIRRHGMARYRARFETPAEWGLRVSIAARFVRGFERTLARFPVRGFGEGSS